ncbi:uncharacterized protein P174DRAFT_485959 [Aspergillus novofumigatus IBT 16806]|uniref:HNH nuclease domain-containing protein n=1 Tax=Aspergillus novofumigatus (strain IBT 16806) TaxID=1392255 RepID=A0A2I1C9F4_ASPN1|nr:uncharacterized protein P174DRAFT_485959 [Aspergillus novofumigatus IBT 16806]PKX94235.1 hypothetical protein P174DRAFT_485959 [Aspergillus novofumigatus IBT 16806]
MAFLEWLPPGGQTSVARDIVDSGNDDHKLWQVFHDLLACILYPMMAESPIPSEPESPFDFREPNLEVFTGTLIQPEVRDPDFRDECARRGGYRCCVTGHLDTRKWKHNGYLPEDEPHGDLECADIIPCSYTFWTGSEVLVLDLRWCCFLLTRMNPRSGGKCFINASLGMFDMAFVKTPDDRGGESPPASPAVSVSLPFLFLACRRRVCCANQPSSSEDEGPALGSLNSLPLITMPRATSAAPDDSSSRAASPPGAASSPGASLLHAGGSLSPALTCASVLPKMNGIITADSAAASLLEPKVTLHGWPHNMRDAIANITKELSNMEVPTPVKRKLGMRYEHSRVRLTRLCLWAGSSNQINEDHDREANQTTLDSDSLWCNNVELTWQQVQYKEISAVNRDRQHDWMLDSGASETTREIQRLCGQCPKRSDDPWTFYVEMPRPRLFPVTETNRLLKARWESRMPDSPLIRRGDALHAQRIGQDPMIASFREKLCCYRFRKLSLSGTIFSTGWGMLQLGTKTINSLSNGMMLVDFEYLHKASGSFHVVFVKTVPSLDTTSRGTGGNLGREGALRATALVFSLGDQRNTGGSQHSWMETPTRSIRCYSLWRQFETLNL